jgi:hypothetical protein
LLSGILSGNSFITGARFGTTRFTGNRVYQDLDDEQFGSGRHYVQSKKKHQEAHRERYSPQFGAKINDS